MKFLVIGLGNFGAALAKELTNKGHEVVAVDASEDKVDVVKDILDTVYIMDTTDEIDIKALPLGDIDIAIVAINKDLASSLRTIVNLRKHGIKHIYSRAFDDTHQAILEALGNISIIMPEREMAKIYAQKFSSEGFVDVKNKHS